MHEVPLLCNQEGKGDSRSLMSHSPHSCPRRIVVPRTEEGDRWSRDVTPTAAVVWRRRREVRGSPRL